MIHFNYHSYNLLKKEKEQLIYLAKNVYETLWNSSFLAHQILRFYSTLEIGTLIGQKNIFNVIFSDCKLTKLVSPFAYVGLFFLIQIRCTMPQTEWIKSSTLIEALEVILSTVSAVEMAL